MGKTRIYTDIEKQKILDELKNVGNVAAVAEKNSMPIGTIHTCLQKEKS